MSRIGKMPVQIPEKVKVEINPGLLKVSGPKGELSMPVPNGVTAEMNQESLQFNASAEAMALCGLTRALANNCVKGVTDGFQKNLEIIGVGYRAQISGRVLVMNLGYSHPLEVLLPDGVDAQVNANTKIRISGIDKQLVGQTAANIRALRKPDPYKQKGVRYAGERLRSKEGKSSAA